MFSWSSIWFWVIGCAVVANMAMVAVAVSSRPEAVSVARSSPGGGDAHVEACQRFAYSGAGLICEPLHDGVRLKLGGAGLHNISIVCERPADARLDRRVAWTAPVAPLDIKLPTHGRWSVRLTAVDAAGALVEHVEEVMLP